MPDSNALERLKTHLEYRLNERLCEMNDDDSITGFNEACVIVARVIEEELTRLEGRGAAMTSPTIIEAAEKALQDFPHEHIIADDYSYMAEALIAAVTPLIEEAALKRWAHDLAYVRAQALEEAAKVAEAHKLGDNAMLTGTSIWAVHEGACIEIAAAVRALKDKP